MDRMFVYLAGPINGCSYEECTDWREYAKDKLASLSGGRIESLSPMRLKHYIAGTKRIDDNTNRGYKHPLSTDGAIMRRDYNDVHRSSAVLVNLLGAPMMSAGTPMEMAWCYHSHIPCIVAIEESGGIYEHPMVREAIDIRVPTLDEAIQMTVGVLLP